MTTEKVMQLLKEKFSSISREKGKQATEISFFFALKDWEHFNVFLDTVPGELVDILAGFKVPLLAKLVYNQEQINEKIHKVVADTLIKLSQINNIPFERIVAKMKVDKTGELTLVLMNGYEEVKPLTVKELFELNE